MWKKGGDAEKQDEDLAGQPSVGGQDEEVIAFVGRGVEFKGVITYDGTVRIDGRLDGEIHTEGVLVVGEDAVITAQVTAGTVISRGKITGDIVASGKVRLESPAVLNGSVKAPLLSIEEGVLFNGSLEMAKAEQAEAGKSPAGGSVTPIRVSSTMKTAG
ncbi:MAG: polymer-forming cytoskeletal protein [Nitrospirae bacterium]|nr:polymer-forming cytoskeletal protein [Nitrospirota bacterium]